MSTTTASTAGGGGGGGGGGGIPPDQECWAQASPLGEPFGARYAPP
jgi:hypothetical protein